ncbi:MAG: mechanosensitive ion channel family protein [Candidatus Woesearchaeota archaeon]
MVFKDLFGGLVSSPGLVIWRNMFSVVLILVITFCVAYLINHMMKTYFKKIIKRRTEHPEIATDTTKFVVMRRVIQVVVYLVGFASIVYVVPEFRAFSYSLLAGAGVAAVIVGFAAQKAFSNIMSGILLAVSEPIRVSDRVTINGNYGTIEDITLRHTVIKTWDNDRVIIPNAAVNEAVIMNHSIMDEKIVQTLNVGISYDSNVDTAKKIIIEEVRKHPDFVTQYDPTGYVKHDTAVSVRVMEFADFSVKLKAYFWAKDKLSGFIMEKDLLESIKKRFDKEDIEIPYPYRTILYKNDMNKRKVSKKIVSVKKVLARKKKR